MAEKYQIGGFIHKKGKHCESSAMRDLFEYNGFPMTEAMAFGLDATMGFGFFDESDVFFNVNEGDIPFFFGGKQETIKPNSLACRLLGITLRKQSFTSSDSAWEEAKKLIIQDIPLILLVDMYYLDYFEFEEEVHFGGHTIALSGFDEEKGIAYVADTDLDGFQELQIQNLKDARNSDYGPSFLQPKNAQFSMKRREDGKHPPLAAGVKLAIKQVTNNMLRPSLSNNGLSGLKKFVRAVPKWKDKLNGKITNPYTNKETNLAELMFDLIYGYIEEWGTGGATFRKLYQEFLEELRTKPELKQGPKAWKASDYTHLDKSIELIREAVSLWQQFANNFKICAEEYGPDCLKQMNFEEQGNLMDQIYIIEQDLFKTLSNIKI